MTSVLMLGGARSGKSRLAQERVERHAGPLTFIATAQAIDNEMAARIAQHKADRGPRWSLVEAPLDLPQALASTPALEHPTLVDCLTLWLGNLMHHERDIPTAVNDLVAAIRAPRAFPLYCVSNEVGQGIVPDNAMARAFRDHAGRLNQQIAAVADEVWFVTAGLAQRLK